MNDTIRTIDLNCDVGESFGAFTIGDDSAVLPLVTSANIGCGFHGGDPLVMHETMRAVLRNGGNIGAHPSVYDIWGFGRRAIVGEPPRDIGKAVIYQIGAAQGMARSLGARLAHVKLHGSLDSLAFRDDDVAGAVAEAVASVDPSLILFVIPGAALERAGLAAGLRVCRELYADRAYADDGNLLSRKLEGAVLHDAEMVADRVLGALGDGTLRSAGGRELEARNIESIAVHGDTPEALAMLTRLRGRLVDAGYAIRPVARP